MTLYISWEQIALRIALACIASLAIGYNRDEHGRPAGMRTVMLVTLTARSTSGVVEFYWEQ
jgi:putative Mg2+ transporter-C (MgtC) family protein